MSVPDTSIDIRELVRRLNRVCADDSEALDKLANLRVACNSKLACLPGVCVTRCQESYDITMIGLLDVFNSALSGSSYGIRAVRDKRGRLQGFNLEITK